LLEVSPYPGLEDTWRYYGRYGARWSEFQKERDVEKVFEDPFVEDILDRLCQGFGAAVPGGFCADKEIREEIQDMIDMMTDDNKENRCSE